MDERQFELTIDEKIELTKKIDAFNTCFNLFKNTLSVNQTILTVFSKREILSDDIDDFLKYLRDHRRLSFCEIVNISSVIDTLLVDDKICKIDTILRVLDKVRILGNTRLNQYGNTESEILLRQFIRRLDEGLQEEFFYKLCDSGILEYNHLKNCETFEELVRKFIGKSKISDPDKFLKYVDTHKPAFKGYPLIIMNENIDRDARIKILKSKYKQKDLPSYIKEIEKNATNLNVVDDFIEATVIQNNRVVKKDVGIITVMKYIFVGDGSVTINRRCNSNIVEFSRKYKHYFMDPSFVSTFYSICLDFHVSSYYRNRNFMNFLSDIILADCSAKECIVILSNFAKYTNTYESISDLILKFYINDETKDEAIFCLNTIINSIVSKGDSNNIDSFMSMACMNRLLTDRDPEIMAVLENNLFNVIKIYNPKDRTVINKSISSKIIDPKNSVDINGFLRRNFLYPIEIAGGGLLYNFSDDRKQRVSFNTGDVVEILNTYLCNVKSMLSSYTASDDSLKDFADKYISIFLEECYLSMIADNIMNFKNTSDEYIKYTVRYSWGSTPKRETAEVLLENIELIKDLAEQILPKLTGKYDLYTQENCDTIVSSLEGAISSVKLLLAF